MDKPMVFLFFKEKAVMSKKIFVISGLMLVIAIAYAQNSGTKVYLLDAYFGDTYTRWAVEINTKILHTTDGGNGLREDRTFTENPTKLNLAQNVPNPFSRTTAIRFSLPHTEYVTLKIYDIIGQEVATLVDSKLKVGEHSVIFDAQNIHSGVYFYRLNVGNQTRTKMCIVLK